MAMTTEDHAGDDYQLTGLKNVNHDLRDHRHTTTDVLEAHEEFDPAQIDREDDESETILLRLIAAVRPHPIIYDAGYYGSMNKSGLKRQKAELWTRIRMELMCEGITSLESVWDDLVDQYIRRSAIKHENVAPILTDRIIDAMQWLDPYLEESPIKGSTTNSQRQENLGIEKEYYHEVGRNMNDDMLLSGCQPVVSHSTVGYVVVQPQRSRSYAEMNQDNASTSSQQQSAQPTRTYSSNSHDSMPTHSQRRIMTQNNHEQHIPYQKSHPQGQRGPQDEQIMQMVKKEGEDAGGSMTMMVDMTTYYHTGNGQKMYRLLSLPPNSQQSTRNVQMISRNSEYDMPPGPIIEGSTNSSEAQPPPRKKMATGTGSQAIITVSSLNSTTTNNSNGSGANRVEDNTIVAGGIPIADDEIIDDGTRESTIVIDPESHLHGSPLLSASPDVMISGQSTRLLPQLMGGHPSSSHQDSRLVQSGSGPMHHQSHHHHHSQQGLGPNESHVDDDQQQGAPPQQQVEVEQMHEELMNQQVQYDADLQFQQLISSHLSRLNDDDKAIMKYNMQRILLEARFGDGTAKQLLTSSYGLYREEDEILETDTVHGEIDAVNEPPPIQ